MVIAHKIFRDEEYLKPKQILAEAGFTIVTASSKLGEAVGKLGAKVKPDILITEAKIEDYKAIVFVGGAGSEEYQNNAVAHKLIHDALQQNKIVAAICIASVILANAGILKSKKATVFPSGKEQLISAGAVYTDKPVEQDGNIITANGPESAAEFAEAIKKALSGK